MQLLILLNQVNLRSSHQKMSARAKAAVTKSKSPYEPATIEHDPSQGSKDEPEHDEIDCSFDLHSKHAQTKTKKTQTNKNAKTQCPRPPKPHPHAPKTNRTLLKTEEKEEETLRHQLQRQQLPQQHPKSP